mmetsp:Transcript_2331/g.3742  ORF Transcript_2331/g.3742 Transcript_2331/m.3742 type:complete len:134 (-) Transcript_2331:7-408(-)
MAYDKRMASSDRERYRQKADVCDRLASEVDQSTHILRNNAATSQKDVLDLHGGYTVQQALESVREFCVEKNAMACRREYQVKIITGRGSHSERSVARIRPAVKEWLDHRGIKHWHDGEGAFVADVGRWDGREY